MRFGTALPVSDDKPIPAFGIHEAKLKSRVSKAMVYNIGAASVAQARRMISLLTAAGRMSLAPRFTRRHHAACGQPLSEEYACP